MTGRVLGIDPGGVSGGWAIVEGDGVLVAAGGLPVSGEGAQRIVSAALFASTVGLFMPALAVVERVGPMPKQGVSSTFKFGRGLGVVEGVLAASLIPMMWVAPGIWKRHFRLSGDKEASRQRAIERWPAGADRYFRRKADHGAAEAALIALWGLHARAAGGGL